MAGGLILGSLPGADAACKLKCSLNRGYHHWRGWSACKVSGGTGRATRPADSCSSSGTSGKKCLAEHDDYLVVTSNCSGMSCPGWGGSAIFSSLTQGQVCIPC
jgi:hypothetical protein